MEFIEKKLKSLKQKEIWNYGNGFIVQRLNGDWEIRKGLMSVKTSNDIEVIAKEIKLTFIAIEITNKAIKEKR